MRGGGGPERGGVGECAGALYGDCRSRLLQCCYQGWEAGHSA